MRYPFYRLKRLIYQSPALALTLLAYLIHFFISLSFLAVPGLAKANNLLEKIWMAFEPLAWFELRILLSYGVFGCTLWILERSFSKPYRLFFVCFAFTSIHLSLLLHHPQMYDDLGSLGHVLQLGVEWITLMFLTLALASASFYLVWLDRKNRSAYRLICQVFSGLLFAATPQFKALENAWAHLQKVQPPAFNSISQPSLFILSLDSLRSDFDLASVTGEDTPFLSRFLAESQTSTAVVTGQPQTNISIASLLREQQPPQMGLRNFLQADVVTREDYYVGPTLRLLKERGYQMGLFFDSQAFAYFPKTRFFDRFFTPKQGLESLIFPLLARGAVIWTYFDNKVGHMLFPELRYNSDFGPAFNLRRFSGFVADEFRNLKGPTFAFVHTCSLHWPTAPAYPFYRGARQSHPPYYSYDSRWAGVNTRVQLSPQDWIVRAHANESLYKSNIQQLARDFLEPLLKEIYLSQDPNQTHIILTSDHGEDHWTQGKYPINRFPTHTQFGLMSGRSEFVYFRWRQPRQNANLPPNLIGVHQILSTVFNPTLPREQQFQYAESGTWIKAFFPGLLRFLTTSALQNRMRMNPSTKNIFTHFDPSAARLEKIRAVYDQNYRLSVFLSNYGFQYFLCAYKTDVSCEEDLSQKHIELVGHMLAEMSKIADIDPQDPVRSFTLDIFRPGFLKANFKSTSDWTRVIELHEHFYKYRNLRATQKVAISLALSAQDPYIRERATERLIFACEQVPVQLLDSRIGVVLDRSIIAQDLLDPIRLGKRFGLGESEITSLVKCLQKMGHEDLAQALAASMFTAALSAPNLALAMHMSQMPSPAKYHPEQLSEVLAKSIKMPLLFLLAVNFNENKTWVNKLFSDPRLDFLPAQLQKDYWGDNILDKLDKLDKLDAAFAVDREYRIMQALEYYLYMKFKLLDSDADFRKASAAILSWPQIPFYHFQRWTKEMVRRWGERYNPGFLEARMAAGKSTSEFDVAQIQVEYLRNLFEYDGHCQKVRCTFRSDPKFAKFWR